MVPSSQESAENQECANQTGGSRAVREAPRDQDGVKKEPRDHQVEVIHQRGRRRAPEERRAINRGTSSQQSAGLRGRR